MVIGFSLVLTVTNKSSMYVCKQFLYEHLYVFLIVFCKYLRMK